MSAFDVQPAALDKCGEAIGTAGGSLASLYLMQVHDYVEAMSIEDTDSAVFSNIYTYNEQVLAKLRTGTTHISSLLVDSGSALSLSAAAYRRMDEAARERYDGQYHAGAGAELDPAVATGGSAVHPQSALTPARGGMGAGYDLIDKIIGWTDWGSISGVALKLAGVFGLHPMEDLTAAIFGDYDSLSRNADALRHLARCDTLSATAVQQDVRAMLASWHGNAADAAENYFVTVSNAFEDRATSLGSAADGFDGVSTALEVLANDLSGALQDAIDAILVAAASAATAGCLVEVPVIDLIAAAVGGYEGYRAARAVERFVHLCQHAWEEIDKGRQGLQLLAGLFASYDVSTSFPAAPYRNRSLPRPAPATPRVPNGRERVPR